MNDSIFLKALVKGCKLAAALPILVITCTSSVLAQDAAVCFESRKDASKVVQTQTEGGAPNVICSETTDGVLWWGDPFDGTVPMGDMPLEADYTHGEAVVKPRSGQSPLYAVCGVACHNGTFPPPVESDAPPRQLTMHADLVADALDLQHGNGGLWCLDCHDAETRNKFVGNSGELIDFNQPQKLCGKCHGQVYRGWRDGLHGKRIGEWANTGKKRWFVCTECHNAHDVQQGERLSGFAQLEPEPAPKLPKGTENANHERYKPH